MCNEKKLNFGKKRSGGFSLMETMMSVFLIGICIVGILSGHVVASKIGNFSAASAAAQQSALERVEQVRSATWNLMAYPVIDELVSTNFPDISGNLELVGNSDNSSIPFVTRTQIFTLLSSIDTPLKQVNVECVWSLSPDKKFTNSITTLVSSY